MKNIIGFFVLAIYSCFPLNSYSHNHTEDVMCKQKEVPIAAEFVGNDYNTEIKIKYKKKLQSLEVIKIRGLDGLVVNRFDQFSIENPEIGQEDSISVSIENNSELQYLVIDFKFKENDKEMVSSVTLAVGSISKSQRQERAKNIRSIKSGQEGQADSQQSGKSSGTKQIHRMGLE